jgi:hypothetical protein
MISTSSTKYRNRADAVSSGRRYTVTAVNLGPMELYTTRHFLATTTRFSSFSTK